APVGPLPDRQLLSPALAGDRRVLLRVLSAGSGPAPTLLPRRPCAPSVPRSALRWFECAPFRDRLQLRSGSDGRDFAASRSRSRIRAACARSARLRTAARSRIAGGFPPPVDESGYRESHSPGPSG